MFIQTDNTGRIVAQAFELEITDGYVEVDFGLEAFDGKPMDDYIFADGVLTYSENPERIARREKEQEQAEREAALAAIIESFSVETLPSDKVGQLWKVSKLGEVEIMREYVPDPNYDPNEPDGSYLRPYQFSAGMEVTEGLWYTDGQDVWECIQGGTAESFTAPWFDVIS